MSPQLWYSNLWDGKFIFGDATQNTDSPGYLFDITQNMSTRLTSIGEYTYGNFGIDPFIENNILISACSDLKGGFCFYDFKENLLDRTPGSMVYSNYSFSGSRLVGSGDPLVLYELGTGAWKMLPVSGDWAQINGDNIVYLPNNSSEYNIYNAVNGKNTIPPTNIAWPTESFWGDNLVMTSSDNVFVMSITSETIQQIFKGDGTSRVSTVGIYDHEVAFFRHDSSKQASYVMVCNF